MDGKYPSPNNALAAVSLSYDDPLNSQLNNAIPALDKYDLKGSFYLTMTLLLLKHESANEK